MSKELSINTLGDAVRERVKGAIFSSIPDEAIEKLIEKEFKNLTEPEYGGRKSQLQEVILGEIKNQMAVRVRESVTKYLDETYVAKPKELVDGAIKELAPIFMASLMESFASNAVQQLRNQLSSKGIYF